jgi:hypothetical protein
MSWTQILRNAAIRLSVTIFGERCQLQSKILNRESVTNRNLKRPVGTTCLIASYRTLVHINSSGSGRIAHGAAYSKLSFIQEDETSRVEILWCRSLREPPNGCILREASRPQKVPEPARMCSSMMRSLSGIALIPMGAVDGQMLQLCPNTGIS